MDVIRNFFLNFLRRPKCPIIRQPHFCQISCFRSGFAVFGGVFGESGTGPGIGDPGFRGGRGAFREHRNPGAAARVLCRGCFCGASCLGCGAGEAGAGFGAFHVSMGGPHGQGRPGMRSCQVCFHVTGQGDVGGEVWGGLPLNGYVWYPRVPPADVDV